MIQYYSVDKGNLIELDSYKPGCWINVAPPFVPNEVSDLSKKFDMPDDFLVDSLDLDERSRYEIEDDLRFILVNAPILAEDAVDNEAFYTTTPIGIVIAEDYIMTVSGTLHPVIKYFKEGRVKRFDLEDTKKFVLQIFEQIVLRYLACLKKLNAKRHLIETELYNSSRSEDLKQLLRIEKSLVYFVNSLSSNELLKMKMKRTDFLRIRDDEDLQDLFEDLIIDNSQALEMANVHTNILSSTMEAYASIISNNLNIVIQRLTLITIILMLPTLVASFYGMNVVGLPFAESPQAFYYIMLFSILISLLLSWFFYRKKMF